jgi:hypothetical protein
MAVVQEYKRSTIHKECFWAQQNWFFPIMQ